MPYYQYEVGLETNLAKSQHALETVEKKEEDLFNTVLSRQKNKLIDLIDLFFPPRFKKIGGQYIFHPTLPSLNSIIKFFTRNLLKTKPPID
jgi:hypothetical protein